jgi:uncharacterized protein YehS (DUF1456 family)
MREKSLDKPRLRNSLENNWSGLQNVNIMKMVEGIVPDKRGKQHGSPMQHVVFACTLDLQKQRDIKDIWG